jgi:hypothetical protein
MAGPGTNYFNSKVSQYEPVVAAAQQATIKLQAAKQGLAILAKPTITQAEAESLLSLHDQSA